MKRFIIYKELSATIFFGCLLSCIVCTLHGQDNYHSVYKEILEYRSEDSFPELTREAADYIAEEYSKLRNHEDLQGDLALLKSKADQH